MLRAILTVLLLVLSADSLRCQKWSVAFYGLGCRGKNGKLAFLTVAVNKAARTITPWNSDDNPTALWMFLFAPTRLTGLAVGPPLFFPGCTLYQVPTFVAMTSANNRITLPVPLGLRGKTIHIQSLGVQNVPAFGFMIYATNGAKVQIG